MPCDSKPNPNQTLEQRLLEVQEAIRTLEAQMAGGSVKLRIDQATGAVLFDGWEEPLRVGVNDACAFRALQQADSFELRCALATAESEAGRTVNMEAIGNGMHSHDGGHTWGTH